MAKLKLIEITGIKLDPHAEYLLILNLLSLPVTEIAEQLQMVDNIAAQIMEKTGKDAIIVPVLGKPTNAVKAYQFPKEITVNQVVPNIDTGDREDKLNGKSSQ